MRVKSFNLYNHKVKISYVKKIRGDLLGDCDTNKMKLSVCSERNNEKLPDSAIEHNRWHEQVHLMLGLLNRIDLYEDETLVDGLAGMLAQYESTKK